MAEPDTPDVEIEEADDRPPVETPIETPVEAPAEAAAPAAAETPAAESIEVSVQDPVEPSLDEPVEPQPGKPAPSFFDDDLFEDDLVGFCTPQALRPAPKPPEPEAAPAAPMSSSDAPEESGAYPFAGATRPFARGEARRRPTVTSEDEGRIGLAIYACLIASVATLGASILGALYLAWTRRDAAEGWMASHILYQLRTSLAGTVACAVGVLTLPVGLGVFILTATIVWVVVRSAAGIFRLLRHEPISDPRTWRLA